MKNAIIVLFVITSIYLISQKDEIIIPSDAVRFRIIANSNSLEDQAIKKSIKNDLINNVFLNIKGKDDIKKNMDNIENTIKSYNVDYTINYGMNYFPEKEYKGVKYPKGNYESLVITLKDGLGDNYWCVMYPPLCFIEENNSSNVEYKVLVKDIIENFKK